MVDDGLRFISFYRIVFTRLPNVCFQWLNYRLYFMFYLNWREVFLSFRFFLLRAAALFHFILQHPVQHKINNWICASSPPLSSAQMKLKVSLPCAFLFHSYRVRLTALRSFLVSRFSFYAGLLCKSLLLSNAIRMHENINNSSKA